MASGTQSFLNFLGSGPKPVTGQGLPQPTPPQPQPPANQGMSWGGGLGGGNAFTSNPFASIGGNNPFGGGGGTLGQVATGGAPTTGNTGGLARASDIGPYGSGTGDPWTDSYVYGGVVMDGSAPSPEAYNRYGPGAGMSSIYPAGASSMSQGQYNYWKDRYVDDWASNGILDAEKEGAYGQDAFAWNVAYDKVAQERGYPPGSYGMVTRSRGEEWISPDGLGPNGEPAHFVSYNGSLTPGFANTDATLTPEQFLAAHRDWVEAAMKDPSIFQHGDAAIWQHITMDNMQKAMDLLAGGGGGGGGLFDATKANMAAAQHYGGATSADYRYASNANNLAAAYSDPNLTPEQRKAMLDAYDKANASNQEYNPGATPPPSGGGGGGGGNRNASGGKPGDHKNTGAGGGRDTKGGGGGGNKGGGGKNNNNKKR